MSDQLQGPAPGNLESATGAIDTNQAGAMFASLISPEPRDKELPAGHEPPKNAQGEGEDAKPLTEQEALERAAAEEAANKDAKAEEGEEAGKIFTVKIDGKEVRLTADELINGYKAQKVSTQKFEQASEMRRTADAELARANAEIAAARQDRQVYAQNLQMLGQQLHSVLQNTAQVDMDRLSVENPTEYVRQKHLQEQRQATLAKVQYEQHRIAQQTQAEQARLAQLQAQQQAEGMKAFVAQQREQLLAKLPDWKDPAKQAAGQAELQKYLQTEGFKSEEIDNVTDHRTVLLARKAMQYDKLMAKAKESTAKVEKVPPKVERPGTATAPTDGRGAAMQRLAKTGSVDDAARIFASMNL